MLRAMRMMLISIVTLLLVVGVAALWSGGGLAQNDFDAEATASQATIEAQQTEIAVLKTQAAGGPGPSEANCQAKALSARC